MKTLEQCTKNELIKYIQSIRPKADAYDRVCKQLGIENNILGYINSPKKFSIAVLARDISDFLNWKSNQGYDFEPFAGNSRKFEIAADRGIVTYYCVIGPEGSVGMRFDMFVETPNAKENKNYERMLLSIKASIYEKNY